MPQACHTPLHWGGCVRYYRWAIMTDRYSKRYLSPSKRRFESEHRPPLTAEGRGTWPLLMRTRMTLSSSLGPIALLSLPSRIHR